MTTKITRACLLAGAAVAASLHLAAPARAQDHAGHDMGRTSGTPMTDAEMATMAVDAETMGPSTPMHSPLGGYGMNRDASGTSWQPDASPMDGVMVHEGGWMLMGHALFNGVHDSQGGPRGDDKTFLAGMVMGMAQRPLGEGTLGFKAMLSPDPFMGKSGYPLLLATGETADGVNPLVDRQHPHDLFMELAASYSRPLGGGFDGSLYAGLPGEPAFGPPAFMHRQAAMDSPEAPITHHWFDSTHITFGVVTAGVSRQTWKVEASAFRGREPDQNRYDIETGRLDSVATRVSWNPTPNWALQASWTRINSPEALEPGDDEARTSLSALYARPFGNGGSLSATLAWARKDRIPGDALQAWLFEGAVKPDPHWTVFTRAEQVEQDELAGHHGGAATVRKLSVGAIYDVPLSDTVKLGFGGLASAFDAPAALGYDDPTGGMAFVRLKIG
ncbi:hypothetical protein ASD38_06735 [Caulobacter sp. Root487D2Y]|uniref:hypothetical protein n=1 Tax=Caulobacter sp. Root487D2Y TaxID=1736547 RepID=UPI0006F402C8|nr:hypothetical protein [Caulobacter sp. Root487D2Y]KQY31049.1 hypothetical protein ASD38_06735 [Caulobacter sp. Root487D2Y]